MNEEIVNGRGQTTPDPGKRCYTVPELQEILKCGKVTVYDLLKKNEFRYIKLGGSGYRIRGSSALSVTAPHDTYCNM